MNRIVKAILLLVAAMTLIAFPTDVGANYPPGRVIEKDVIRNGDIRSGRDTTSAALEVRGARAVLVTVSHESTNDGSQTLGAAIRLNTCYLQTSMDGKNWASVAEIAVTAAQSVRHLITFAFKTDPTAVDFRKVAGGVSCQGWGYAATGPNLGSIIVPTNFVRFRVGTVGDTLCCPGGDSSCGFAAGTCDSMFIQNLNVRAAAIY